MYLHEGRWLAIDAEGVVWRKGRETSRRLLEPRRLGHVEDDRLDYRVPARLLREFHGLLRDYLDDQRFGAECRALAER